MPLKSFLQLKSIKCVRPLSAVVLGPDEVFEVKGFAKLSWQQNLITAPSSLVRRSLQGIFRELAALMQPPYYLAAICTMSACRHCAMISFVPI
jgi:hypothetical protein